VAVVFFRHMTLMRGFFCCWQSHAWLIKLQEWD
jgi:hypothetical protein